MAAPTMSPHTAHTYTVTCESHDEAVVHCLVALAHFAEHTMLDEEAAAGGALEPCTPAPADLGWEREEGRVTFRFSEQGRRGIFLGEATRLLSGKWTRAAVTEEPLNIQS